MIRPLVQITVAVTQLRGRIKEPTKLGRGHNVHFIQDNSLYSPVVATSRQIFAIDP